MRTCCVEGCDQPRASRTHKGRIAYRERCIDHHREHERIASRKRNRSSLPVDAPALPMGRYVLFDFPNQRLYVVRGNKRFQQPYLRPGVNRLTLEILKYRHFDVKILEKNE